MRYSFVSKALASLLLVGMLAACGSSNDPAPAPAAPTPTTFTVSGTAATGAALDNATITITDAAGNTYPAAGEAAVVTGADGSYTITLPLTATPPFVVQAVKNDISLVSVVPEAKDTTTNITPVTHLIASRLSSSGDPAKLAAEIQADPTLVDLAKVTAKVAEVVALIKPVMNAVGITTDPLTGSFAADGTGLDRVLDSLSITITPSSANSVNIEVAVKQKQTDETAQPAAVMFTNTTAPATALPTVSADDLVPSGTAELIADLLQRANTCYALPLASRVNSTAASAADIIAPECKDIFLGNDPTSYLHNGQVAKPGSLFDGIFNDTGNNETFDRGIYEFTRKNGDLVISLRSTDKDGNVLHPALVVRADTDGKLRAIGNQYKYSGGVNAYHQLRTFVNVAGADYYSTGYNLTVSNKIDSATGQSIFAKVLVTSPRGSVLTLKPTPGSSYLPLVKDGQILGTNFVRIRSVYVDSANSAKDPSTAEPGLFFAGTPFTDEEIAAIPAQATWKFEYFLAGNTTTTPDETQYYKTRARAMTIAELQTQALANVVASDIADAKANSVNTGTNTYLPADDTSPIEFSWEVPQGALAPTSIQVYGRGPAYETSPGVFARDVFNDKTRVDSTARTGAIPCSAGAGDNHCDGSNYAADDRFNGVHLWAQDTAGRDFAHFYAFYQITP